MRRIDKSIVPPHNLFKAGHSENTHNQQEYDFSPQKYNENGESFDIKKTIYGNKIIKQALKEEQYLKCCYCEKHQGDEPGAVEHYRPKGGYHSTRDEKLKKPGYYWLGYEWTNLYFVCCRCNTTKGNLFPLVDESTRAKSHHYDINLETPYLIDPGGAKDPRAHIVFENHLIRGVTEFGKITIKICNLDRRDLDDMRLELISNIDEKLADIETCISQDDLSFVRAKNFIGDCQKPAAQFSATAIDYLRQYSDYLSRYGIQVN
ncbi:HNH endonuclease family protein [Spirosoma arcticum]